MLGEYKVSRCSRQCFTEKRPLREGESFYSVVISIDGEFERRDYSADAWTEPPEGTVGVWKSRMPDSGERKMVLAPREVLIDLLRQMESAPEQSKLRYLLALLLLRKRIVKLAAPATSATPEGATPDEDRWMHLEVSHDGSTIEVAEREIDASESDQLSEALTELLYCEAGEPDEP